MLQRWVRDHPERQRRRTPFSIARWQTLYFKDRILIRMDPGWTQFEKTYLGAGQVVIAGGIAALEAATTLTFALGRTSDSLPEPSSATMCSQPGTFTAELEFPAAKWNLAFGSGARTDGHSTAWS